MSISIERAVGIARKYAPESIVEEWLCDWGKYVLRQYTPQ